MPELEGLIRPYLDDLNQQQLDLAEQSEESLAALEAYQQQLTSWHEEIERKNSELAEQRATLEIQQQQLEQQQADLEQTRQELQTQQAAEIAANAKLDQARAEIDDLRQQLESVMEPLAASTPSVSDTECTVAAKQGNTATVEAIDPTVSAVAKQFQKLRDQQTARRTAAS